MLKGLLSLFLQDRCPLCDRIAHQLLCLDCQGQLLACQGSQLGRYWSGELPLFIWGKYEGKLKQAIAAMKYENQPQIGFYLGQLLAQAWQAQPFLRPRHTPSQYIASQYSASHSFPQPPTVIPIPLHPQRYQERGFNQSVLIAQGFCQIMSYKLEKNGIRRARHTAPLFQLNQQQRQREVEQAFELGSLQKLRSQKLAILLIDDIYTTGSTALEVAKMLKTNQFKVIGIAAIAKA